MSTIKELIKYYSQILHLEILAGKKGTYRKFSDAEICRPSLGSQKPFFNKKQIALFGNEEVRALSQENLLMNKLNLLMKKKKVLALVFCDSFLPSQEIIFLCDQLAIPLFRTILSASDAFNQFVQLLINEKAPKKQCEGSLVEVFGVGVLIQADFLASASEAAIGLVEKHHRLISDGTVTIRKREGFYLEGSGLFPNFHYINLPGFGPVNITRLYGAVRICNSVRVNIIVKLEEWNQKRFYDRVGLEEKYCEILGIRVPIHVLPIKPGRDMILLLETIALNHHLKNMGCHSVKEFETKLLKKCLGNLE